MATTSRACVSPGLIRENDAANPEPFDEVWHVRKKSGDKKPAWLIAGIQQTPE